MNKTKTLFDVCWKCDGSGDLPHFSHIDNGRCWACGTSGQIARGRVIIKRFQLQTLHEFKQDGVVWQFAASVITPDSDSLNPRAPNKGERANDMLASEMTRSYLGDPGQAAMSRNKRGISWL